MIFKMKKRKVLKGVEYISGSWTHDNISILVYYHTKIFVNSISKDTNNIELTL